MLTPDPRASLSAAALAAALAFACNLLMPAASAGADLPALLDRAQLRLQSRATSVRVNGVALQWSALASGQSPARVSQLLGLGWRTVEAGADPSSLLLTRRDGDELHVLQLRGDGRGGSEGYWSVLDPTRPAASAPRAPLSMPAGARIESAIEQLDPGLHSTQYLGRAHQSAAALGERLRRAALTAGWVEQLPGDRRAGFQAYARGAELLELQVLAQATGHGTGQGMDEGADSRFLLNVHDAGVARMRRAQ